MTTFSKLRAANILRQNEWDPTGQVENDLAFKGIELAGEVGEACNVIKKLLRERSGIRGSRATLQDLAEELADVVICADLVAMAAGIALDLAVVRKFNATSENNNLVTRLVVGN
jgi:NTP pyrophosphatase (non-canonical NTP hydrolase)